MHWAARRTDSMPTAGVKMRTERTDRRGKRTTQCGFMVVTETHNKCEWTCWTKQKNKNKQWNQCDAATGWRRLVSADLAVDVGPGVEQHLNHGLVTAYAGVHERGHSLQEGRGQEHKFRLQYWFLKFLFFTEERWLIGFPPGGFSHSQI